MNPSIKPFWVVIGFDSSTGQITILGFGVENAVEAEIRCKGRILVPHTPSVGIPIKGDKVHLRAFEVTNSNLAPDMVEWLISLGVKMEDAIVAMQKVGETMLKTLKG